MRILAFIFSVPLLFIANASQAQTFTGCLKSNGTIVNVAIGEAPSAPCGGDSQQISWNSEGPEGAQGPQGPQGPTGPAGPPGADAPIYIFADFSDVTATGDSGLAGLYSACQSKFGPDSKMCTSQEVLDSTTLSPQTGQAWVHPVFVGFTNVSSTSNAVADVSGEGFLTSQFSPHDLTCAGWSEGRFPTRGLTVTSQLGFETAGCEVPRPVACCTLQ